MLRKLVRSPHIAEVIMAYGGVHLLTIFHIFHTFNEGWKTYFVGLLIGSIIYTFIEYWFHRYLLHVSILKKAHDNHHARPTLLKIIATPLIPVQVYEMLIMMCIAFFFGAYAANLCQVGISISQVIMDYVHYFEHSAYKPWFLRAARNFHKLHHQKSNHDVGFGLTCPFWDWAFNTLPTLKKAIECRENGCTEIVPWKPFEQHPWIQYVQVPIPMVSYLVWTPFVSDTSESSSNLKMPSLDGLKIMNVLIAAASALVVGYSPFFVSYLQNCCWVDSSGKK